MPGSRAQYTPVEQYAFARLTTATNINTTGSAIAATGSQTCTPASMTGIVAGLSLVCDTAGSQETVVVQSTTGTTFTATFTKTHTNGFAITASPALPLSAVGVATFAPASLAAGAGVVVTPGNMAGIQAGSRLWISDGTHRELASVTAITATTFTIGTLTQSYTGPISITSLRPAMLGRVTCNQAGSAATLTLYDGNPGDTLAGAKVIATITNPAAAASYPYGVSAARGLFYTLIGNTLGEVTVTYLDDLA